MHKKDAYLEQWLYPYLILTLCMVVIFTFFSSSANIKKNQTILSGIHNVPSQCQTVWAQIRPEGEA